MSGYETYLQQFISAKGCSTKLVMEGLNNFDTALVIKSSILCGIWRNHLKRDCLKMCHPQTLMVMLLLLLHNGQLFTQCMSVAVQNSHKHFCTPTSYNMLCRFSPFYHNLVSLLLWPLLSAGISVHIF